MVARRSNADVDRYILRIGDLVKAVRTRRGMTRKLLSEHSDVSERYLSQVESGKANISIALLCRIAHAMDIETNDLLPSVRVEEKISATLQQLLLELGPEQQESVYTLILQHLSSPRANGSGVALIGLRGAGKTALGSALGKQTGLPFVDLVKVVEKQSGMQVGELFSLGGQKAYGRAEEQALDYVLENYPRAIIEAGGSLVTRSTTFQRLLSSYYTVWIKAAPEEHMERVVEQGDLRPMQGNERAMEDLKGILGEREKEYRAAQCILDTSGRSEQECLQELFARVGPLLKTERGKP